MNGYKPSIDMYKKQALDAAKDLGYSNYWIKQIKNCNDENRIAKYMAEARKEKFKEV